MANHWGCSRLFKIIVVIVYLSSILKNLILFMYAMIGTFSESDIFIWVPLENGVRVKGKLQFPTKISPTSIT